MGAGPGEVLTSCRSALGSADRARFLTLVGIIPMDWAVNGLLFCTAVGLTFGMWPAMKASKLAPIDALGYE